MILSRITQENAAAFKELAPGGRLDHDLLKDCFMIGAILEEEDGKPGEEKISGKVPAGLMIFDTVYTEFESPHSSRPDMHLMWLFVREDLRKRGIGRELMKEALSLAVSAELREINCSFYAGEGEGDGEDIKSFLEHYSFKFITSESLDFTISLKEFERYGELETSPEEGYSVTSLARIPQTALDDFFNEMGMGIQDSSLQFGDAAGTETIVSSAILKGTSVQGIFIADVNEFFNGESLIDNVFLRVLPETNPKNIQAMIGYSLKCAIAIYGEEALLHIATEYPPSVGLVKYFVKDCPAKEIAFGVYNFDKNKIRTRLKSTKQE